MKGTYKHYKGGIYEVIGLGKHTETGESLVFYKDNEDNFWARPTEMFKGTIVVNGEIKQRFERIK